MNAPPESTLVIILGAGSFPKLPDHMSNPAFRASAGDFRRYLLDPHGFGLADKNLLDLFDSPAGPSEQDDKIVQFLKLRIKELEPRTPARDLIVYYVGHGGFFPPHDQYFLALASTKTGSEAISGYPMHSLAVTLKEHSPWLRHYLILDCCFSAAAYQAFQGSGPMQVAWKKTEEELPAKGTALLCAASPRDPAKALPGHDYTMFSGVLLDVLRQGAPDLPERLSLAQVGRCTEELIRVRFADKAVRPEVHSPDQRKGDPAKFPLFPNHGRAAAFRSGPPPVPTLPPLPPYQPPVSPPPFPKRRAPWWRSRLAISVALILAAGAMLIATLYYMGVIGPLPERVRRTVRIRAVQEATGKIDKDGIFRKSHWFWIEAPPSIMNEIATVIYRIPPPHGDYPALFPREQGFKGGYRGRGTVQDMEAIIKLSDGREVTLPFNMHAIATVE